MKYKGGTLRTDVVLLTGGQRRRLARAGLKGFVAFKFDKADDMVWLLQEKHPLTEEAWKIYEKELEEPDLGLPKTYKFRKKREKQTRRR
jgi:hypothetical protein